MEKGSFDKAAELFGMPQPKVSAMLNGRFRGISEEKMMRCLLALGQNVQFVLDNTVYDIYE